MFWRQANIPGKGQGLASQAQVAGLTRIRKGIVAGQITDAMKLTGTTKMAMAARMHMD
jgi:hypothetical protein